MECEFKIKKNILEMRVVITSMNRAKDLRIRVGRSKAYELVEQFECPKNHKLGICLTPHNFLDNFYNNNEGIWLFELIDLAPQAKPKPKKTSGDRQRKKTSAK